MVITYDPTSGRKVKLERPLILNIASNTEIKQTVGLKVKKIKPQSSKYGSFRKSMPSLLAKIKDSTHKFDTDEST